VILVTYVPAGTITTTVKGATAGTSTILASGTVSGTVIVTELPGTITITTNGPAAGTSTVPVSGTVSGTVIVTTCTLAAPTTTTVSAVAGSGAVSQIVVPLCASKMVFSVTGGSGNNLPGGGGFGARLAGARTVTPGQNIVAIAGGQGQENGPGGTSLYGSGGSGGGSGGSGGGGASALFLGTLSDATNKAISPLAVAGGGGGGSVVFGYVSPREFVISGTGNADDDGQSRGIGTAPPWAATCMGGSRGTAGNAGAGGQVSGTYRQAVRGNAGNGYNGGNSVFVSATQYGYSGAGGGGYGGGGSGAAMTFADTVIPSLIGLATGGGGGGGSFMNPGVNAPSSTLASAGGPGFVVVTFT